MGWLAVESLYRIFCTFNLMTFLFSPSWGRMRHICNFIEIGNDLNVGVSIDIDIAKVFFLTLEKNMSGS